MRCEAQVEKEGILDVLTEKAHTDWLNGIRIRKTWNQWLTKGEELGVTKAKLRLAVQDGLLLANDIDRLSIATKYTIDPETLAMLLQLAMELMPMFMAMCPTS
jgi:hypothetical protein